MDVRNGKNVLIAGGTGLIGTRLHELLKDGGYNVGLLSRRTSSLDGLRIFKWDPASGAIDPEAIPWADYVINLAGEGIADKSWSPARKKTIQKSRIDAAGLLVSHLNQYGQHIKLFLAASAIGVYGNRINEVVTEISTAGNDFLAQTCQKWETANGKIKHDNIRVLILRIGIVLSLKGGALKEILKSFKFRIGIIFGKGSQVYSWIHTDDLCMIMLYALNNHGMSGGFNAVSPNPVSNEKFVREIAFQKRGYHIILYLPAYFLKLFLGQRAAVVLNGQHVSSQKIINEGYTFKFPTLADALKNLLQ